MSTLALRDSSCMPALGLGTWLSEPELVYRAVRHAIEQGYRHIDAAFIYQNESEVGRGIQESIAAGVVRREELWVTTKLWNDAHASADVKPALERSLRLLGLDYVDLYLVHWPVAHKPGVLRPQASQDFVALSDLPLAQTWEAMLGLRTTGLARHLGVSNFNLAQIDRVSEAVGEAPQVNQIELHPYLSQTELLAGLRQREIVATAYCPLGSSGRPAAMRRPDEHKLLEDPVIESIAKARGATAAQVLIAWGLGRGTAVIPKSTNPERISQNWAAAALDLDAQERAKIDALNRDDRYVTGDFWCPPGSPYSLDSLWRT